MMIEEFDDGNDDEMTVQVDKKQQIHFNQQLNAEIRLTTQL